MINLPCTLKSEFIQSNINQIDEGLLDKSIKDDSSWPTKAADPFSRAGKLSWFTSKGHDLKSFSKQLCFATLKIMEDYVPREVMQKRKSQLLTLFKEKLIGCLLWRFTVAGETKEWNGFEWYIRALLTWWKRPCLLTFWNSGTSSQLHTTPEARQCKVSLFHLFTYKDLL